MFETLALVTFLLANGTKCVQPVFPPSGDYHKKFVAICEKNKPHVEVQVRKLLTDNKITKPDGVEQILSIKIFCAPTTKA